MPRRVKRPADDEALVREWQNEHSFIELIVTTVPSEDKFLVGAYRVADRVLHGSRAETLGIGMHRSLLSAMLQAIDEVERSGAAG